MKKIHISRKKTLIIVGIAAVALAAATLIPKAMKSVKHRRYSASF
ncbi:MULTISPECIES: hypothetical protein [Eubacteriales]|nr:MULTISPECIES: hypothetical protein [Eubacteriales]